MVDCTGIGLAKSVTLGEILRAALPDLSQKYRLPNHHWKVLRALAACGTSALGGHQYLCTHCGEQHFVAHTCGNRHCPNCQRLKGAQWLEDQTKHLLPIPYFHVVFTLPHELNPLIQHNQARLYSLLFSSAAATLLEFGRNNLKAKLGVTAVLHTWGQNLSDHYHLHCVVTGGGLSQDEQSWVSIRPNWLFPVRALSMVFRAKFRDGLNRLFEEGKLSFPDCQKTRPEPSAFAHWLHQVCRRKWVVYTKRPFAGPKAFLGYLCRYTHRVAIHNNRLEKLDLEDGTVTFRYKDYADGARRRSMTLSITEFLRRFCLHILPSRFVKIRHYGLLSNRDRPARIGQARALLPEGTSATEHEQENSAVTIKHVEPPPLLCPHCGQPTLVLIGVTSRPQPPPILDSS